MNERQEQLLILVIENHITTAEPIGSKFLVKKGGLDWSEATVRNDLRELEEQGFLTHPHTSAGRVPTARGYRFYVNTLNFSGLSLPKAEQWALEKSLASALEYETARKSVARELVELSNETVVVAFSPDIVYYTGLSNLFQKPDFVELDSVVDVSAVFDRCEEVLGDFFGKVSDELEFFVGGEHPFGSILTVLATRFGERGDSLIALVGPQRMDYKHNWELMKKVSELI